MEYTHVGHLGLVVSRLCLGTMNFGPHTPEPDSYTIMDSAVAYGINFFDTANVFGRHLGVGATEEIIGRWFTKGDRRRDKVVLATKVYGTMGDWPNESRLSKLGIVDWRFLRKYRRHAIVLNVIVAAVVTPTGDPFNLALMAVPMLLCYELGVLGAWIFRKKDAPPRLTA